VPLFPLRGRVREIADAATSFGTPRSRRWAVSFEAIALDEEDFAADREWARAAWTALRPFAPDEGAYVNFEYDADAERVLASYGREKYNRLAALKAEWDPDNVFRSNVNISPQPAATGVPSPRVTTDTQVREPSS